MGELPPTERAAATNTQSKFWDWFMQHEVELFGFDSGNRIEREKLFDRLAHKLQNVHRDLTFEFGPKGPRREFVISAAGMKDAFPAVVELARSAPALERWQFIAFRPRRSPVNIVEIEGKRIDPKDVTFSLLDNGQNAGLYLFIPGFQKGNTDLEQIGYLLLDEALGEYDVETRLGLIKMLSPETQTDGERFPLSDLPDMFDRLVSRLERRSGSP